MTAMNMAALAAIVNGSVVLSTAEKIESGKATVEAARKASWEREMAAKEARREMVRREKAMGLRPESVSVKATPQAVYSRK